MHDRLILLDADNSLAIYAAFKCRLSLQNKMLPMRLRRTLRISRSRTMAYLLLPDADDKSSLKHIDISLKLCRFRYAIIVKRLGMPSPPPEAATVPSPAMLGLLKCRRI